MITCPRCGNPFEPIKLKALGKMSRFCDTCGLRNIIDGLDMPTPPELLDSHSKIPTLTEEEFQRKLNEQ